jgi:hypothetical protein
MVTTSPYSQELSWIYGIQSQGSDPGSIRDNNVKQVGDKADIAKTSV